MKRILILLAMSLPFVVSAQSVELLWKKAQKAASAGKPKTQVTYLKELESIAVASSDELEQLYISDKIYNALSSYNWKEAREYWPVYYELQKKIKGSLDSSITANRSHKRLPMLLVWRLEKQLDTAYSLPSGKAEAYRKVWEECRDFLFIYGESEYAKQVEDIKKQLEGQSFSVVSKIQSAPGETVTFKFYSRNVDRVSAKIYLLNEGYYFSQCDIKKSLAALKKNSRLVEEQLFTAFKHQFNIQEENENHINFKTSVVYVIFFDSGEIQQFSTVYVSSIAAAVRLRQGTPELYAADITTGKPLSDAMVTLFANSDKFVPVEKSFVKYSHPYHFDGFTKVEIDSTDFSLSRNLRYRVSTDSDKSSPMMDCWYNNYKDENVEPSPMRHYEVFFTDRSLYSPGDTIYFKTISYNSNRLTGNVAANKALEINLYEASSRVIAATTTLVTNEMGSAAGFLVLPDDCKSGMYRISTTNGSRSFRVETYKRPTFEVTLDASSDVYGFSDVVNQCGHLSSFAGYGVSGARVEYEVTRNERITGDNYYRGKTETVAAGSTYSDTEGGFEISFPADRPAVEDGISNLSVFCYYNIVVKVTDPQGETHENYVQIPVSDIPVDIAFDIPHGQTKDDALLVNRDDVNSFVVRTTNLSGVPYDISGKYEVSKDGKTVITSDFKGNVGIPFSFSSLESGLYTMRAKVNYRGVNIETNKKMLLISPSDRKLSFEETLFYYPIAKEGTIDFLIGTSEKDLYLAMELMDGERLLYRKALHLEDELAHVTLPFPKEYGSGVTLSLYGFRNGEEISRRDTYTNPRQTVIPLSIESFRDRTSPNTKETIRFRSVPGAELLVSIFDASADGFLGRKNDFDFSPLQSSIINNVPRISSTLKPAIRIRGYVGGSMTKAAFAETAENAIPLRMVESNSDSYSAEEEPTVLPRHDFRELIGFFPHIRSDKDGCFEVEYVTNDLLSTYRVLAIAHTKDLKKGNAETSFVVSKPLMVIPNLPLFVREGDRIVFRTKIVNLSSAQIEGKAVIDVSSSDGKRIKGVTLREIPLRMLSGTSASACWEFVVPKETGGGIDVEVIFSDGKNSDGERHHIIVEPDEKEITEALSFVIGEGRDFKYYEKLLKKQFPSVDGSVKRATYSTLDAVKESLPKPHEPGCDNVINWISEYYVNQMRGLVSGFDEEGQAFRTRSFNKIRSFQGYDGGIRWFSGMAPSRMLTLFYLERMAQMRSCGALVPDSDETSSITKAIGFIDRELALSNEFGDASPWGLTQMLDIRMMWSDIPLGEKASGALKSYLAKSVDGWQGLSVIEKSRHLSLLLSCRGTSYDDRAVAGHIKIVRESLEDYAVKNETAGLYFPNAVRNSRGLMNNDIYAHSRLLHLFARLGEKDMVAGISRWLLLQKHNQDWGDNVATADATFALLCGNAPDLKLGAVYLTYKSSMKDIKPSSNEIEITREFLRPDGKVIAEGEHLAVGDEIIVRYNINNSEKRSFVAMKAMRSASLYPVDGRSYYCGWGCYRQVKASYTSYYWELLPEYKSSMEERFYVTQEGSFTTGLVQIESLYASEYRGHTASSVLKSE